jgi:hypothetical protein
MKKTNPENWLGTSNWQSVAPLDYSGYMTINVDYNGQKPSKKPPKNQQDANAIITKQMLAVLAEPATKANGVPMPRLKFDVFANVRGLHSHFPAGTPQYNSLMPLLEKFSTLMAQYVYCSEALEHAVEFSGEFSGEHDEATDAFIQARKMLYFFMREELKSGTPWDDTAYPEASPNEGQP